MVTLKKYLAPLLCLVGLWLALTASAKPPVKNGDWPDSVPYAAGGLALALLGAVLWRRQQFASADALSVNKDSRYVTDHERLWNNFLAALQVLHKSLPSLQLAEISTQLANLQDQFILPLVQARMVFFVESDRDRGLERLTAFSRGELWLNRAQSTAGDQHREETLAAIAWAVESFLEVQESFPTQS